MNLFAAALASGPIAWRRWNAATLSEAHQRQCLIVVLAGAATDHWSVALAAELIADHEACQVIDQLFVPVVAETLEDPALCARLQQALAVTADAVGWPACVVCLPDGRPVGATAWRPVRDRDRRQGLLTMLLTVAEAWVDRPTDLDADAGRLVATLEQAHQRWSGAALPSPTLLLDNIEAAAMAVADPLNGGFGPPPRSMDATLTRFLLARCARDGAPLALVRQVERHIAAVVAGGIHDQIGGGFHRAVADVSWREVFAEKRLLDNALWAWALLDAATILDQPVYATVAERTLRWCFATLGRDDGICVAGIHSTTRAGNGAYYQWTVDQLAEVIGEAGAEVVAQRFGLDDQPRVPAVLTPLAQRDSATFPAFVQRLAVARSERPAPPRDERLDPSALGALLTAVTAMRDRGDAAADLVQRGQLLATHLENWTRLPDHLPATPAHRAWLTIGLAGWNRPRAEFWYAAIGKPALQDATVPGLDPIPPAAEDGPDGPGLPGLIAWAALALDRPDDARAVIATHAGLLRQAPLAAASLGWALEKVGSR